MKPLLSFAFSSRSLALACRRSNTLHVFEHPLHRHPTTVSRTVCEALSIHRGNCSYRQEQACRLSVFVARKCQTETSSE
jgi:hypothetical protein